MLKLATVFTGIGAIEHALQRMGVEHEIVFASDNGGVDIWEKMTESEKEQVKQEILQEQSPTKRKELVDNLYGSSRRTNYVKQTYFENYKFDNERWHEDVEFINGDAYKNKVDLFVGGSPCQSFSSAGKQGGFEDTRGTLFYEFARLVKEIEPRVFIYENVKGMLTHDKGNTWKVIQNVFDELGYTYYHQVLNSKDYGIPQNRNRIIVVGFKNDTTFEFPKPLELTKTMQDLLEENAADIFHLNGEHQLRNKVTIDKKYFLSDRIKKTILSPGTKNYKTAVATDLKVARPLLSSMHKMHRAGIDNYVTTDNALRRLTPREALRLMGFCDSFKQVVSDTQMYKQAGNSIVVDLLIHVMDEILKTKVL